MYLNLVICKNKATEASLFHITACMHGHRVLKLASYWIQAWLHSTYVVITLYLRLMSYIATAKANYLHGVRNELATYLLHDNSSKKSFARIFDYSCM